MQIRILAALLAISLTAIQAQTSEPRVAGSATAPPEKS